MSKATTATTTRIVHRMDIIDYCVLTLAAVGFVANTIPLVQMGLTGDPTGGGHFQAAMWTLVVILTILRKVAQQ